MKTTLDMPDTPCREFKARTATNGKKMRNAVISFKKLPLSKVVTVSGSD